MTDQTALTREDDRATTQATDPTIDAGVDITTDLLRRRAARVQPNRVQPNPLPRAATSRRERAPRQQRNEPTLPDEGGVQLLPRREGGFPTILADPPWRFANRTGKVAPEHRRLGRYSTMTLDDICGLDVAGSSATDAHLYLWVPNALLPDGIRVMQPGGTAMSPTSCGRSAARTAAPTVVVSGSTSAM